MSSHDHDRLLDEGPERRKRAGTSLAPAGGTRSRRRPAARAGEKAPKGAPAPRHGEAQPARSTRPRTTSTATRTTAAEPAAPQQAAASEPAPRPRPRPTPRPRPAAEPAAEAPSAVAAVVDADEVRDVEDAGELVAAGEAAGLAAVREVTDGADGADVVVKDLDHPAEDADAAPAAARGGRARRLLRRRPALYLAAALAGALGVGAIHLGSTAQADPAEEPSHSMSVAAELGISSQTVTAPDVEDTERLRELAASRATREAEQSQAVAAQQEADRLAAEAIAEANRPKAVLPVNGARLTSGFGLRWGSLHAGIDLAAPMLTPEYAAMDGVVLEAGPASGYGNVVYIQHANGDVTVYGHMEQILVQPGQVVKAGDTIALLGNRGQSTGPHLHFEVHVGGIDGEKVDPVPWLRERGVQI
ncbi:M23 family metallopeptidase [Geodermatophilus sp. SYSU D00815]